MSRSFYFAGDPALNELAGAFLEVVATDNRRVPDAAVLIKENRLRGIYRLEARGLVAKVHRSRRGMRRISSLWRNADALREWRAASLLAQAGIPVANPLAVAVAPAPLRSGAGVYMCEWVPEARTVRELWNDEYLPRSELARLFAGELSRLHRAGFEHGDLHAANLLGSDLHEGRITFKWIDVKSARRRSSSGALARTRALGELASFLHSLQPEGPLEPELRQIAADYLEDMRYPSRFASAIDKLVSRIQGRRIASRARRCMRNSSKFHILKGKGWKSFARRDCPLENLQEIRSPSAETPGLLKMEGSTAVWCDGGLVLKRERIQNWRRWIALRAGRGRARRAWRFLHLSDLLGLPVPAGVALHERWRPWRAAQTLLVTRWIPNAIDLKRVAHGPWQEMTRGERREILLALVEIFAVMMKRGVRQKDFSLKNILLVRSEARCRLFLVDFESFTRSRWRLAHRLKALIHLNDCPRWIVSSTDRLRFIGQLERLTAWRPSRQSMRDVVRGTMERCRRSGRDFHRLME